MQHPPFATVASALAHGFLAAGAWSLEEMVDAGARVLGERPWWLGSLVHSLLAAYPRKPADAVREVAATITASAPFAAAVAQAQRQNTNISVAVYVPAEPELRPGHLTIPPLAGLSELADYLGLSIGELGWFADTGHWNRLAVRGPLQHYRYKWLQRPGRTPRLLEVPGPRLKSLQRTVLSDLLAPIPLHNAAHGFVPGRSPASGASLHTGAQMVISLDLTSFFARVGAGKIYGALRQAGYPEAVAHSLTGLCTHVVPPWVITAMPAGGSPTERFALAHALRAAHLPQGAPSSPALANIAVRRLDSRLHGWAEKVDARYTRYADDLTFSGDAALARRADSFVRGAQRIIADEGLESNKLKTRVRPASTRQQVTGIVVNQHGNAPRSDFETLKAIVHNCVRHGPASQNREYHPDFRAQLLGRITWHESLNPARGARLRRDFERIIW